jgi:hypothetical protein
MNKRWWLLVWICSPTFSISTGILWVDFYRYWLAAGLKEC